MVPLSWYLIFSAALFSIGLFGVLSRRNAVAILLGVELMLNSVNVNLAAFWRYGDVADIAGQVFAVIVFAVAAAEREQSDKGEEAGIHRLNRWYDMFMAVFLKGGAVRGQTLVVMISFGLTIIVITNAVEENHQHGPCHEEQRHSRKWIHQHADLEPRVPSRQPIDG